MKKLSFLLILQLFAMVSLSQERTYSGKIVAFQSYPLNNVEVYAKKSKDKVYTDSLGKFTIKCKGKEKLKIKANGFFSQAYKVKNDTTPINLVFINTKKAFHQVVKAKHMKADDLYDARENKMAQNTDITSYGDIFEMIQAHYPNATIDDSSGEKVVYLLARGLNSATADNSALLVVDGIIVSRINEVAPLEVASLEIIQGADASEYGSRGANGVIRITLKR